MKVRTPYKLIFILFNLTDHHCITFSLNIKAITTKGQLNKAKHWISDTRNINPHSISYLRNMNLLLPFTMTDAHDLTDHYINSISKITDTIASELKRSPSQSSNHCFNCILNEERRLLRRAEIAWRYTPSMANLISLCERLCAYNRHIRNS